LQEAIDVTEGADQPETIKKLVSPYIGRERTIDSREVARIYNIIDMNIVPLNVHALMRDIPLANLVNYSYTCDRMIQDVLLPRGFSEDSTDFKLIKPENNVNSTRALICKMLLHPYADLTENEYSTWLHRVITGDSGLDLGRPKFLGDQMWNKSLFQQLYRLKRRDQSGRPIESGPRAEAAQRGLQSASKTVGGPPKHDFDLKDNRDDPANVMSIEGITSMQYLTSSEGKTEIKESKLLPQGADGLNAERALLEDYLSSIGRMRFDTKLTRNVFFLVQMQRIMRMCMRDEMTYFESPVVSSSNVVSRKITEFEANDVYDPSVFHPGL
jgi:hypothetical protein